MPKTIDSDEWALRFKRLACNLSPSLRKKEGPLSKDTTCASFELEPHRPYTPELYLECRWDVFSTDPAAEHLERDVARVVVLLEAWLIPHAERLASHVRKGVGETVNTRVSESGRRIYITQTGLPTLDLSAAPFSQKEQVGKYAEACARLQELWKSLVPSLDAVVSAVRVT